MYSNVIVKPDHFTCTNCKIVVVGFDHYKIYEKDHKLFPNQNLGGTAVSAQSSVIVRDYFTCPTCNIIVVGLEHYRIHEMDHKLYPNASRKNLPHVQGFGRSLDTSRVLNREVAGKRSQHDVFKPTCSKLANNYVKIRSDDGEATDIKRIMKKPAQKTKKSRKAAAKKGIAKMSTGGIKRDKNIP